MQTFQRITTGIQPLNFEVMKQAQQRLDSLIKPIGSLGKLEQIAIQLAGISGNISNELTKTAMVIMSADNGVCAEGVSACPQSLTVSQTINFTKGLCGINVLSRHAGMDLRIVDIGIAADLDHPGVIAKKVRKGTANMAQGAAMSREEAFKAINVGIETMAELVTSGYQAVGTGEMGIGNTSTSSAILMAFTGCDADVAVGKGAGLTLERYLNKKQVIQKAIAINAPNADDPVDVLSKVGGLDIAGLAGCFLAAAYYRIPIIIDGFISAAAALTAYKINPLTRGYMVPSHNSAEPGYKMIMQELGLDPLLNLEMRLGEGTGCPLALQLMSAATKVIAEMATFEEASLQGDFLVDIR